ncbi:MAG TPA: aminotransferase class V-fold PLP-dependent enzyme [Gemmatimonadaceae bacterium]
MSDEQPISDESSAALIERIRRLERASRALDPGSGRRKTLRNAVMASSERHLRKLHGQKGYVAGPDQGAGVLSLPIARAGHDLADVIALYEREVVQPGAHPSAPSHLAYIPGSSLYHSALADFLAAISNKYSSIFFSSPGAARLENMMVRWVADLVGYPESALGSIVSGGSIANLTAIVTARDARDVRSGDVPRAVVYLTTQTHHCIQKSLRIAGLGEVQLRYVATDARHRMRPDALATLISEDRARGLLPWMIVATAGSTDVGAVDPLEDIGDVAEREGCWYHVDAAYGGFFLLTDEGRRLLKGIERSHSVVLDPHKSLFMPWGAGVVIVRDGRALMESHGTSGHYMQDALRDDSEISPADLSPELTKPFRGLRMWLPLMLLGTQPFADALEEKLLLARYFRGEVAKLGFEVGPAPELSVVTYRWAPQGMPLEETDALNQRIIEGTHADGRVFLSSTMLDGRFTLRMVALSFRTHKRNIDMALRVLHEQLVRIGLVERPAAQ